MPQAVPSTAMTPRRSPRKDPFRYGHRWVDGEMVPLTYDDVLDPQIGDFIAENTIHNQLRGGSHSRPSRGRTREAPGGDRTAAGFGLSC